MAYGENHFITFDEEEFDLDCKGEYTMLELDVPNEDYTFIVYTSTKDEVDVGDDLRLSTGRHYIVSLDKKKYKLAYDEGW